MSIIYDALKKAEDNNPDKSPKENKSGASVSSIPKQKGSKKNLLIIIVFVVLFLGFLQFAVLTLKKVVIGLIGGAEKKRIVAEKKYRAGKYELEGILYNQDEKTAIINGKVLSINDTLDHYVQVVEITPQSVQLLDTQENKKIDLTF